MRLIVIGVVSLLLLGFAPGCTSKPIRIGSLLLFGIDPGAYRPSTGARFTFVAFDEGVPVDVTVRATRRAVCPPLGSATLRAPDPGIAVAKALADVPDANVMTNVLVYAIKNCTIVEGNVGRVAEQPAGEGFGAPMPAVPPPSSGALHRGSFARLSAVDVPVSYTVVNREASGEVCASVYRPRLQLAAEDALAKNPPANALVAATYEWFRDDCIRVRAMAVKVD